MIVCRGTRASFLLTDGRTIRAPVGSGILQDETGQALDAKIAIVMPFRRTGRPLSHPPPEAQRQVGRGHDPLEGRVALPPLSRGWRRVGEVREAHYSRRGEHDGDYEHAHGEFRLFHGTASRPVLYARGNILKIELARGCWWGFDAGGRWDWRGVHG